MTSGLGGDSGPALWQAGAALAAVLALLILVLRLLQRWQPGQRGDAAVRLLANRRLGPRRELQVLRVGDEVHTLYRQEGAMVLLKTESWESWSRARVAAPVPPRGLAPRLLALAARAGGAPRNAPAVPDPAPVTTADR
jgi:hypothetical protein